MQDTKPIRSGEEIDASKLADFLLDALNLNSNAVEISQFPAGASNLTYCVKLGDDEYVLRRPPFGNRVKTAHDMSREFNVLSKLSKVYKPAPKPILYCDDESIIGSEFYLMERRKGLIIRGALGTQAALPAQTQPRLKSVESKTRVSIESDGNPTVIEGAKNIENSQECREKICESFIKNLADLHALDYKAAGLGNLGKPIGYTKRQVEGWTKRYFKAKTDEHKSLEKVIIWLNENIPEDDPTALVHNDYKFDNVMLNPEDLTEIVAVLDWEMATIGSPLMDLGTTLAYWMSKDAGEDLLSMPFNPRILMENVLRRTLVQMYAEKSGQDVSNIDYYYVFGTFKVAVIAQQIYYRYVKGFTKDERFANFGFFVKKLGEIGLAGVGGNTLNG